MLVLTVMWWTGPHVPSINLQLMLKEYVVRGRRLSTNSDRSVLDAILGSAFGITNLVSMPWSARNSLMPSYSIWKRTTKITENWIKASRRRTSTYSATFYPDQVKQHMVYRITFGLLVISACKMIMQWRLSCLTARFAGSRFLVQL